jgi:hypothetical protein
MATGTMITCEAVRKDRLERRQRHAAAFTHQTLPMPMV